MWCLDIALEVLPCAKRRRMEALRVSAAFVYGPASSSFPQRLTHDVSALWSNNLSTLSI